MMKGMNYALFRSAPAASNGRRVAIVGAGPSGLAAAGYLCCQGYHVEVFDKLPKAGGLLYYGIPDFRLPVERTAKAAERLQNEYGVVFHPCVKVVAADETGHDEGDELVQETVVLDALRQDFDAVLLCTGSWRSRKLNIPGEDLPEVLSGLEFLFPLRGKSSGADVTRSDVKGKRVAVIGAGLSAVDAADCALRGDAETVYMLYRRTSNEAPAGPYEIALLQDRGLIWKELAMPSQVLGEEHVCGLEFIQCSLGDPDASGRRSPVPMDCAPEVLDVDIVIPAVGEVPTVPDADHTELMKVRRQATAWPRMTPLDGVFLAGDALNGPSKIGWAVTSGLEAARSLEEWLDWTAEN
ncbi:FAD-dependent oxidoreductase [Desulfobaculum bizertense]|uniref:Glutamate synthase (NADPH/NADH) small chain n=1 Tax=Desulfobaculum bizertense DSM 18034 TaxID=1121442 RepID=A0A1T4VWJ2_9BACT|nr:FAD-dependent oxidoreductase [Desulfobaculum bizertense]UIJ36799.1 FAD-dependent oxidoreductase [Desulfobaculum bizertense]SKA69307.1 glutamate synthase (NADPH/NADH) small chain [Desulfobaculum bizertense DSM 18034]